MVGEAAGIGGGRDGVEERGGIGPKAESLRRMADAGLPVPEARFLGADAYLEHAARAGVAERLAGRRPLDASAVRDALGSTPVDPALDGLLRDWHRDLGGGKLAVRSSGSAEDWPGMSFAGQHGTYFVDGPDELVARVRDCWASVFTERAVGYREEHGVGHDAVAMGVIVQRLVDARAAGVAFTADPVTDANDVVIVETCLGLGEALVSGKVTPDRFVFARDGLALQEATPGDKRIRIVMDVAGAVTEQPVEAGEAAAFAIGDGAAREVAEFALRAEALFAAPVGVEWAWDGERIWLLQSRPITTLPGARPTGLTKTAAPAEPPTIWSNVNTGEILPDVATPMTWTIIHGHADELLGGMFGAVGVRIDVAKLVGLVGGRIYFNLTLLRDSFRHLPGVNPDIALGGMHDYVELPAMEDLGPSRGARLLAVARVATILPGYVARHTPKKAGRIAAHMRSTTADSMARIAAARNRDEAYQLVVSLNDEFSEFSDALAFTAVATFGFGLLGGLTSAWLGDATGALANRLVAGQGDVASAEAGHAMWGLSALARGSLSVRGPLLVGIGWADVRDRLEAAAASGTTDAAEFLEAWDAFMAEHGHHRRGELEFANATWAETPGYVLGIVRSYLVESVGADPMGAYAERAVDADRAATETLARLSGPKRAVFRGVLGWGRASARTRENMKSEVVRWLVAIRHALLALGARLAEEGVLERADDVFFLEYGELEPLVQGNGRDWRALVAARRAEHARLEKLSPPPVVVGTWDEGSGPWAVTTGTRVLKGITVSAGVARGRARVFLTADTDEPVLPGEILVAPFTDPGWTPYFVPAAGIVVDMGGPLSHGSIIAREYGIPAVVNVGPATRLISTGDLIEVDGEKGEVRILR